MGFQKFIAAKWSQTLLGILLCLLFPFIWLNDSYRCAERTQGYGVPCTPNSIIKDFSCQGAALDIVMLSSKFEIDIYCPWEDITVDLIYLAIIILLTYVSLFMYFINKGNDPVPLYIFLTGIAGYVVLAISLGFMIRDYGRGTEGCQFYQDTYGSDLFSIECNRLVYEWMIVIGVFTLIPSGISIYRNYHKLAVRKKDE